MKQVLLKKLLGIVQIKEYDDQLKIQKFYNCIQQEEDDDVDMLEYFFTCMLHPFFYNSFENPSIFITHSKTYEYVMKTCDHYFSNTPSSLMYGLYFGYIQYQYMFHNESQSDVQFQRKILENLLILTNKLIPHMTTRYSKKWLQRFVEKEDFVKVFLHFCHDLENQEHYIDLLKKSEYLQDCFKNSLVALEVFFNYIADILPTQWIHQMIQQKDVLLQMYKLGNLKSMMSFLLFRKFDYFQDHSLTYDELNKIFQFIETSLDDIHEFHNECQENPNFLKGILKKKQKSKKKNKKKKIMQLPENIEVPEEPEEIPEEIIVPEEPEEIIIAPQESKESKDYHYYYDESNEFIDLYNTLSFLDL
jgi:hypothetical protein